MNKTMMATTVLDSEAQRFSMELKRPEGSNHATDKRLINNDFL
jgi:hypothetical protein